MTGQKTRIGFHSDATGYGGAEHYLHLLIKNLDRDRYDVYFFHKATYPIDSLLESSPSFISVVTDQKTTYKITASDQIDESITAKTHFSIKNFTLNKLRLLWRRVLPRTLKYRLGLKREIRQKQLLFSAYHLDIMHSNDTSPLPDVAAIAARQAGIAQVLVSVHVLPELSPHIGLKRCQRWLMREVGRSADAIITNSRFAKTQWAKYIGQDTIYQVVPLGIDVDHLQAKSKKRLVLCQQLNINPDCFVIGLTGRLTEMKGHRYVIAAAADILRQRTDVHFLFVGEGELRSVLEKQIKELNLSQHFTFTGHIKDADAITKIYDIALLPSVAHETFGFVNLEAMAFGIPVIASRFSGIPEVVLDQTTGVLVPPGDVSALVEAIFLLLNNPDKRQKFGEAGLKRVKESFLLRDMIQRIYALYTHSI